MENRAHAVWEGSLAEGSGVATLGTGIGGPLPMSWPSRTEDAAGKTSPEELIAAAHASCYSMALSGGLGRAGFTPTKLETDATATFRENRAWLAPHPHGPSCGRGRSRHRSGDLHCSGDGRQGWLPGFQCPQRQRGNHD